MGDLAWLKTSSFVVMRLSRFDFLYTCAKTLGVEYTWPDAVYFRGNTVRHLISYLSHCMLDARCSRNRNDISCDFNVYIAIRRVSRSCMGLHSIIVSTQECIDISDEDIVLPTSNSLRDERG